MDFLKLNIEGMELPVLEESADSLPQVRELVLEYHGWPGQAQQLGPILDLLDGCGFRYLINHFDYETNDVLRPPFMLERDSRGSRWSMAGGRTFSEIGFPRLGRRAPDFRDEYFDWIYVDWVIPIRVLALIWGSQAESQTRRIVRPDDCFSHEELTSS